MFDDRTPIYRQIADEIRHQILTGGLAAGDQVMSTTQYSTFHRINPATVAKAFQQLVDEDLLEKRRGIGMFVSEGAADRLRTRRRAAFVDDVVGPMMAEARRLGIATDDVLDAIRAVASTTAAAHTVTAGDQP
ncbi:MAG TPA: GntR family transcriptional regulator [Ilumatobacteraceae bacterium]|nr:GntR family transcriptional regulator [Ilumatobacteraceae bacterium]